MNCLIRILLTLLTLSIFDVAFVRYALGSSPLGHCPVGDLVAMEKGLTEDGNFDQVGYTFSVSIDPEKDTPAKFKELETQYQFAADHWNLLTGDEDGILELAVALGMKYRRTSALDFAHSNFITMVHRDDSIAHQQVGMGEDKGTTLAAIRAAAKRSRIFK